MLGSGNHGFGNGFDFGGDALYHLVEIIIAWEKAITAQDFFDAFTEILSFFRGEEQGGGSAHDCSAKECKQMFHVFLSF